MKLNFELDLFNQNLKEVHSFLNLLEILFPSYWREDKLFAIKNIHHLSSKKFEKFSCSAQSITFFASAVAVQKHIFLIKQLFPPFFFRFSLSRASIFEVFSQHTVHHFLRNCIFQYIFIFLIFSRRSWCSGKMKYEKLFVVSINVY